MADVLSQAQIDALLNAVRSGDKDLEQANGSQERKYQKYDFSSPRKFTKDRIKMLSGIFENYSRVISSRLNGRLRSNCEVTVENIEEQRYYEFANALTEGDVLGMIDVELKDVIQETPAMLFISTATALSMMDVEQSWNSATIYMNYRLNDSDKFRFIGELSVLNNSPLWHFDEEFCKWNMSNPNLKREVKLPLSKMPAGGIPK